MIDWEKEHNKLYKTLLAVTILIAISLIMFIATFSGVTTKLKEKDNKITKQQIEILDLKEQLYIERSRDTNEV